MVFVVTTLTPATAAKRVTDDGLAALGLAAPFLSPRWSDTPPAGAATYDPATMTLTHPPDAGLRAPFRAPLGFLSAQQVAAEFTGADGHRMSVRAAVLRLHPQAAARLARLVEVRYGTPRVRPVPAMMLVHEADEVVLGEKAAHTYEADEPLVAMPAPATVTFHDDRGMIVDPIAVAALFADLLAAFPALHAPGSTATVTEDGGISQYAGLASGVRVLVTDLHGAPFAPATADVPDPAKHPVLVVTDAAGTLLRQVPPSGAVDLAANERLAASAGDATSQRLRWTYAVTGTLSREPLATPALPTTPTPAGTPKPSLPRQFLRVCAVDLVWHLLGNRTTSTVLGQPAPPTELTGETVPLIRDRVRLDYLADGPDVLAAAGQVLARLTPPNTDAQAFFASPDLEPNLALPPSPGTAGHWPAFPVATSPNPGGFGLPVPTPAQGITAVWAAASGPAITDVIVTIAAAQVPPDAAVRIYPQRFVDIAEIGPEPSFVRGDGAATLNTGAAALAVQLTDPLDLRGTRPTKPPTLLVDIVVTPRVGRRRLFAAVPVIVTEGTPTPPTDPFSAATDPLAGVDQFRASVCRTPLFGLVRDTTTLPTVPPNPSLLDLVRHFISENPPREGPRLPTMARFETIIATGIPAAGIKPDDPLGWDAVLTGGRWARESRSAQHTDGNPGNPAGPDLHISGVRVDGGLAYDLGLHTMRRAQPMLPTPPSANPGWLVTVGKGHMSPPTTPASDVPVAGQPPLTGVGVALQTVAVGCETPELATVDDSDFVPTNFSELLDALAKAFGLSKPPPIITPSPTPNADRAVKEARKEFVAAKHGARDALFSLRRAIAAARELVYVEGPQLAHTAAATDAAGGIDLIEELRLRLSAEPGLRVVLALPRLPDAAPAFGAWVLQALKARTNAVNDLRAAAPDRVVVFHPAGFPGRTTGLRSTTVVVDDVWCLTGATHWRRRGMTFDGSACVASFDRQLSGGYSTKVREFRRRLMAAKLGVPVPTSASDPPSADWIGLARPAGAFAVVARLLRQGGLGRIEQFWPGPPDLTGAQTDAVGDPDGRDGATLVTVLAGQINQPAG